MNQSGAANHFNNKARMSLHLVSGMPAAGRYGTEAASLTPVLGTNTTPSIGLTSFFTRLCPLHQRVERYFAHRLNLSIVPNGPLNPNAFLKGLHVFDSWTSETKNALMNDLFQLKPGNPPVNQSYSSASPSTVMSDTLRRIYAFACSQVAQVSGPDIVNLLGTLQQMPRQINYPEKFLDWIARFTREMSPLMVKNAQFADAVAHFRYHLAPLSANLKQVKLNEEFIVAEIQKWTNNASGL